MLQIAGGIILAVAGIILLGFIFYGIIWVLAMILRGLMAMGFFT